MKMRTVNSIRSAAIYFLLLLLSANLAAQSSNPNEATFRPVISNANIAVEAIAPVAADDFIGEAYLRKPPGVGPFPAVILIHGGAPRWPSAQLQEYAVHVHASRFLEAGYVVAAITRRDLDLNLAFGEEQQAVVDAVAVVDYLRDLPYVDAQSIVVRGTSVGGYLALEVGAAREVAAIMVEEPFSMPFVGIALGPDASSEANTDKIAQINSPILLIRGDQTPNINNFNQDIFIPALRAMDKVLTVLTYPGELHSFAFYNSPERTLRPAVALEAFQQIEAFFAEHVITQPTPLDSSLVAHEQITRE